MPRGSHLALDDALRIADAVRSAATKGGARVGVVVLDAGGHVVATQRMDGAYMSTLTIAERKAFTALNFGAPTAQMVASIPDRSYQSLISQADPRLTFIDGGAPISRNGEIVGAVGVSGASASEDDSFCQLALADFKRSLAE